MAFSDLCHIGNAYQTVENETDQVSAVEPTGVVNHNSDGCCKCLDLSTRSKIRLAKQEIVYKSVQLLIH